MKAVVIVANGWNAGWLGCYGNEWVATPRVDCLAAESVIFDQHFAVNPSPIDWRRSLTSGQFELGDAVARSSLIPFLRKSGLRTVRIQHGRIQPHVDQDDWDVSIPIAPNDEDAPGEILVRALADQLQHLATCENWVLWIETDRLTPPWSVALDYFDRYIEGITPDEQGEPPQPWDEPPLGQLALNNRAIERLHGTFASVVTEWDADLGRCFDLFRQCGLAESALWILTSGHGQSLGEHGWIGPLSERPHEELAHVPLLLRLPGGEQAGRRIEQQTSSADVLPTLAEALHFPLPANVHGRSLFALVRGSHLPLRNYHCQEISTGWALRTPDWASLWSKAAPPLLFRKPEDRWEMNNLRMQHLEWAEYLDEVHRRFVEAAKADPFNPPELKDYDDIEAAATPETEINDEHGSTGERDDRSPESESHLRGDQSDQED